MAMTEPVALWIIANRPSSEMMPTKTRISLITPCCCNRAIQDVVRTSNDVQKGNSTRMISRLPILAGCVAIR